VQYTIPQAVILEAHCMRKKPYFIALDSIMQLMKKDMGTPDMGKR
jgi:hypothetical protein